MSSGRSFADLLVTQKSHGTTKLEKIHALVKWDRYKYRLDKILSRSGLGPTGYDPLRLFQALILQNLYGLSDPEMEEMLYDRISFRRFCGFSLNDKIPDETTLCRFRGALQGHTDKLFALVLDDIKSKGISLKSGTIIDATVIASSVKPPAGGQISEDDVQAGWTKKRGDYIYGYKAHVGTDVETGLIKRIISTSGDVHDGEVFAQLLDGDEPEAYADKAYESRKNRQTLKDNGIADKIMYKAPRNKRQPRWQVELNKLWSKTRCGVERVFGHWKRNYGMDRCRYKGWEKNQVHFDLVGMAYNLNRTISILGRATG